MMRMLIALLLLALAGTAHAHKPSDSYLILNIDGASVQGQWDIALRDLDFAIGLDGNGDGAITWGEAARAPRCHRCLCPAAPEDTDGRRSLPHPCHRPSGGQAQRRRLCRAALCRANAPNRSAPWN